MDNIPMDAVVNESYVSPRRLPAWKSTVLFDPRHPVYNREDPRDEAVEEGMDTCPEGKILLFVKLEKKGSHVAADCRRCFSKDLTEQKEGYAYCIDCGYAVCFRCLRNCTPPGVMCLPPPPPPAVAEKVAPHGLEYPRLPDRKHGAIKAASGAAQLAAETLQFSRYPAQIFAPPIENGVLIPQTAEAVPPCADAAVKMLGMETKPKPAILSAIDPRAVLGGGPGNPGGPLARKWVLRGDDVVGRGGDTDIVKEGQLVCLFRSGWLHIAKVLQNEEQDAKLRARDSILLRSKQLRSTQQRNTAKMLHQYKDLLDVAHDIAQQDTEDLKDGPKDEYLVEIVADERAQRKSRLIHPPAEKIFTISAADVRSVTASEAEAILSQNYALETELIEVTSKCLSLVDACTHTSKPHITRKKGNPRRNYSCEYVQCNWCGKVLVVNSQDMGGSGDVGTASHMRMVFDEVGERMLDQDTYRDFRKAAAPPLLCGMKRSDGKGWTRKVVLMLPELQQLHRRGYIHTADFRKLSVLRGQAPKLLDFEKLWLTMPDGFTESFTLPNGDAQVLVGPSQLLNGATPITDHSHTIAFLKDTKSRDERRKVRREEQQEILYQRAV